MILASTDPTYVFSFTIYFNIVQPRGRKNYFLNATATTLSRHTGPSFPCLMFQVCPKQESLKHDATILIISPLNTLCTNYLTVRDKIRQRVSPTEIRRCRDTTCNSLHYRGFHSKRHYETLEKYFITYPLGKKL